MATYYFKTVENGMAKFGRDLVHMHKPSLTPTIDEYPDRIVLDRGHWNYEIFPATDTVIIDETTHAASSLTVSQLSDIINVLFPEATTMTGGGGSNIYSLSDVPDSAARFALTAEQRNFLINLMASP